MIEKISILKPIVPFLEMLHQKIFPAWYAASSAKAFVEVEREILLLPLLIPAGSVAVDIGAHSGAYIWHLLRFTKMVEAFEPNPDMVRVLERAFANRINVHQVALSDRTREAELEIPYQKNSDRFLVGEAKVVRTQDKSGNFGSRYVPVQVEKLDNFLFKKVGFIKIDVEGHEMNVLEGGRNILSAQKPNLLIEAEQRHRAMAVPSLVNYLKGLDYAGFFC